MRIERRITPCVCGNWEVRACSRCRELAHLLHATSLRITLAFGDPAAVWTRLLDGSHPIAGKAGQHHRVSLVVLRLDNAHHPNEEASCAGVVQNGLRYRERGRSDELTIDAAEPGACSHYHLLCFLPRRRCDGLTFTKLAELR